MSLPKKLKKIRETEARREAQEQIKKELSEMAAPQEQPDYDWQLELEWYYESLLYDEMDDLYGDSWDNYYDDCGHEDETETEVEQETNDGCG